MQRDGNNFLEYNTALLRRITIGNNTIEKVRKYKLLGVVLTDDLKWIEHVLTYRKSMQKIIFIALLHKVLCLDLKYFYGN